MDKVNDSKVTVRIVLYQPEIPANTGNIGRLCVGTNAELHIVKPMRFFINDKSVKRAGLDYWPKLKLVMHDSWESFVEEHGNERIFYATTKTDNLYTEVEYQEGDFIMFGPESRGIPEDIMEQKPESCITIPMSDKIRSINLSNSVAIVLYEAMRQINFNI